MIIDSQRTQLARGRMLATMFSDKDIDAKMESFRLRLKAALAKLTNIRDSMNDRADVLNETFDGRLGKLEEAVRAYQGKLFKEKLSSG